MATPYSTAKPLFGKKPGWIPAEHMERVQSYDVYDNVYANEPETFKVVARGAEDNPIYIPSGKTIVDTTARYVGIGFGIEIDPAYGQPAEQEVTLAAFNDLFVREDFFAEYAMNKRSGLIRGDWLWHVTADELKSEGSRISIKVVHPGNWFPEYDPMDAKRLIRVHLADVVKNDAGEDRVLRQTYEKTPLGIRSVEATLKVDEWLKGWEEGVPEQVIMDEMLPPEITAFPVYHIRNSRETNNAFGSSELRGLERIIGAINQAMSDEDIVLALEGIGVYATDGGGPVDEDGNEVDWIIGPGEVIENAVGFKRVNGVSSFGPYGEHLSRLWTYMKEASGTPDVAIGKVDVQVAESGISLTLQMGPMLSKAEEKDLDIVGVHSHLLYDLRAWFKVYEGINMDNVRVKPRLGEKLPRNRSKEVETILSMVTAGVMSRATARPMLALYGYTFAANEEDLVNNETKAAVEASSPPVDPLQARMEQDFADAGAA